MEVLGNLDGNLLLWIQEFVRQDWMDGFWKWITMLGDSGWFWILLSALLMIPRSTRQVGLTALLALLIGALCTNVLLKNLVARVRPYETVEGLQRLIEAQKDFSFPSGQRERCLSCSGRIDRVFQALCGGALSYGCTGRAVYWDWICLYGRCTLGESVGCCYEKGKEKGRVIPSALFSWMFSV